MTKTARMLTVAATALLAGVALTGCTINLGTTSGDHDMGMMGETKGDYTADDIMFMQMMIPHHQQAVDMGTLAETRASNPKVKALAAQIKKEQAPEITQMKGWLTKAGASTNMGHTMAMNGMLSDSEMTALTNATGAEFDRLYLEGMIVHHEGAISMASMVLKSDNAEAKALGEAIVKSQTAQIAYMKELLAKL
jgi:uncharacterized protein (DUF305 family)